MHFQAAFSPSSSPSHQEPPQPAAILTIDADLTVKFMPQVIPNIYLMEGAGRFSYQISVQTGLWRGSGTTANVGLEIHGDDTHIERISLKQTESGGKCFSRGSVNSFIVSFPEHLGQLYKVRVWHDNSGTNPSWYLKDVVITDLQSNQKHHFIAEKWLALERGSGRIESDIPAASPRELSRFKTLFITRVSQRLADGHLWLSLFTRPPQSPFTRTQRLTCCITVFFMTLVTDAMFCQFGERQKDVTQVGPLKVSLTQIKIGIQSAIIVLPINVVIVAIFRSARPSGLDDCGRTGARSRGLPRPCVLLAWALCLLAVIASATITVFYSLQWGADISREWLTSIVVSFLQDVVVSQPIMVVLVASVLSALLRKPLKHDRIFGYKQRRGPHDKEAVVLPDEDVLAKSRAFRQNLLNVTRASGRIAAFVMFVILLFVVCYGNRSTARYTMTKSLEDTFSSFKQVRH